MLIVYVRYIFYIIWDIYFIYILYYIFILSGFNSEYIPEFIDIYIVFMEYVCKLYNLSMILVDEL